MWMWDPRCDSVIPMRKLSGDVGVTAQRSETQ